MLDELGWLRAQNGWYRVFRLRRLRCYKLNLDDLGLRMVDTESSGSRGWLSRMVMDLQLNCDPIQILVLPTWLADSPASRRNIPNFAVSWTLLLKLNTTDFLFVAWISLLVSSWAQVSSLVTSLLVSSWAQVSSSVTTVVWFSAWVQIQALQRPQSVMVCLAKWFQGRSCYHPNPDQVFSQSRYSSHVGTVACLSRKVILCSLVFRPCQLQVLVSSCVCFHFLDLLINPV